MHPPLLLFLKDSREVRLYNTLPELESSVEAIDVINSEYEAFDAQGQRIDLFVDQYNAPRGKLGSLEPNAARMLILSYYSKENPAFSPALTVEELVRTLIVLYSSSSLT